MKTPPMLLLSLLEIVTLFLARDSTALAAVLAVAPASAAAIMPGKAADLGVSPGTHDGLVAIAYLAPNQENLSPAGNSSAPSTEMQQTTTVFYHSDHLGSSTVLTDPQGHVVERVAYYPYGSERTGNGQSGVAHRFTGQELDADIGLYDYGARFYDPIVGRFISTDRSFSQNPEKAHGQPRDLNTYAYANDNPLKYLDPNGLEAELSRGIEKKVTLAGHEGKVVFQETTGEGYLYSHREIIEDIAIVQGSAGLSDSGPSVTIGTEYAKRREYGISVVGDRFFGFVTETEMNVGYSSASAGVEGAHLMAKAEYSAANGTQRTGFNIGGFSVLAEVSVRGGVALGVSLGLDKLKVDLPFFSMGISVDEAKGRDAGQSVRGCQYWCPGAYGPVEGLAGGTPMQPGEDAGTPGGQAGQAPVQPPHPASEPGVP